MADCITTPEALAAAAHLPPGLPGFEVPRLVRDIEGAPAKVSLAPRLSIPRAGSHGSFAGEC